MEKTDIIIIEFKGRKAKEYILNKMTKGSGIRFKEIPKESIVIEETGKSTRTNEIFDDLINLKVIDEVEFKTPKSDEFPENPTEIEVTKKEKMTKGLGNTQIEVLKFLKEHHEEKFSIKELSIAMEIDMWNAERILKNLDKRNLIERVRMCGVDEYFFLHEEIGKNVENQEEEKELSEKNQGKNELAEELQVEKMSTEEIHEEKETTEEGYDKKESAEEFKEEKRPDEKKQKETNNSEEVLRAEKRRKIAIEKQTDVTKKILKMFLVPKYDHILNEIFKKSTFNVEALRKKFDYADCETLTKVIKVLDEEAIKYDEANDGTYNVECAWREYARKRLKENLTDENFSSKEIIEELVKKGLIYEKEKDNFELIM